MARAGSKDQSLLSADVVGIGKLGPVTHTKPGEGQDFWFGVSGLTSPKRKPEESLRWVSQRKLQIGDQVLIKIVDAPSADQPRRRNTADRPPMVPERERFEYAKGLYYKLRRKYEGDRLNRRSNTRATKRRASTKRRSSPRLKN